MLFLLSPAKSLDYDRPLPRGVRQRATEPLFLPQASALIDTVKPCGRCPIPNIDPVVISSMAMRWLR